MPIVQAPRPNTPAPPPLLQHVPGPARRRSRAEELTRPLGLVVIPDRVGRRRAGAGAPGAGGWGHNSPSHLQAQNAVLPDHGPEKALVIRPLGDSAHGANPDAQAVQPVAVLRPPCTATGRGGGLGLRAPSAQAGGAALDGGPQIGQGVFRPRACRQLLGHLRRSLWGRPPGRWCPGPGCRSGAQPSRESSAVDAGERWAPTRSLGDMEVKKSFWKLEVRRPPSPPPSPRPPTPPPPPPTSPPHPP